MEELGWGPGKMSQGSTAEDRVFDKQKMTTEVLWPIFMVFGIYIRMGKVQAIKQNKTEILAQRNII